MRLLEFIPVKFTLLLVAGILIGFFSNFRPLVPMLFTAIACLCLGIAFYRQQNRQSIFFGLIMIAVVLGLGATAITLSRPKNHSAHYTHQDINKPYYWHLKIREIRKSGSFADRYIAAVKGMDSISVSGKILLGIRSDSAVIKLQVDDELVVRAVPREIRPPLNPHQFNYKGYLEELGIYHQLQLEKGDFFLKNDPETTLYGHAAGLRERISIKLKDAGFGIEELGVINALLMGDRNDISAETYTQYKDAGAVHILALSGLHIGILLLLLQFLLRPLSSLPHGNTIKLVTIVALLWGFAFIAGLSASLVRAVTMFSFVAYALYLKRPANTFNILALSMFFILLLFNPMLLFHVGFQMSYAAVLAIVWIYPKLQRFWYPGKGLIRKIWQLTSVSLAAQLGVLPIALYYFHKFPGLFIVSNILIVPFLGLILGLGIGVVVLSLLGSLPGFLVVFYNALIHWMNALVGWVAQQEAFLFRDIPFDRFQVALSYGIILALVLVFTRQTYKRTAILLLAVIAFQTWSVYLAFETRNSDKILLLHQIASTVIVQQQGVLLQVFASNRTAPAGMVNDFKVAERIRDVSILRLQNCYRIGSENLFIVDRLGMYPPPAHKTDIVLLTQSPQINLARFLDSVQPARVLADGSNYSSYIERWKNTCAERKLPFHHTGEKGAYEFSNWD